MEWKQINGADDVILFCILCERKGGVNEIMLRHEKIWQCVNGMKWQIVWPNENATKDIIYRKWRIQEKKKQTISCVCETLYIWLPSPKRLEGFCSASKITCNIGVTLFVSGLCARRLVCLSFCHSLLLLEPHALLAPLVSIKAGHKVIGLCHFERVLLAKCVFQI